MEHSTATADDGTHYEDVATYTCIEGYERSNGATVQTAGCTAQATWGGTDSCDGQCPFMTCICRADRVNEVRQNCRTLHYVEQSYDLFTFCLKRTFLVIYKVTYIK